MNESGKTFLLVHGAWHGAWCWRRVADRLRQLGHVVFTPTLTGLGERRHLLNETVDLDTHIADVVNVIEYEDLRDVVLVGHSYGGFVISGVAEKVEGKIASFVLLDAFVPEDGHSMATAGSAATREATKAAVERRETTVPPRSAAAFDVNEADRVWVDRLCCPQPIGTLLQPVRLTGARERIADKRYIRASSYPAPHFDAAMEKLRARGGWRIAGVRCGHDIMIDKPDELVDLLVS